MEIIDDKNYTVGQARLAMTFNSQRNFAIASAKADKPEEVCVTSSSLW